MGKLVDTDDLIKALNLAEWFNIADFNEAVYTVMKAQPVDAIPIDWINLFNCTPIGGDSIDDMLLEWRYQQEVKAERERDENGDHHD